MAMMELLSSTDIRDIDNIVSEIIIPHTGNTSSIRR